MKIWQIEGEKRAKCLKPERPHPPKLVCMHTLSTSTCMNILSQFYFLNHMVQMGNLAKFEGKQKETKSPKPEWPHPPKLVFMHFASSSTCIIFLIRFYLILFDSIFCPLWTIYSPQCQKGSLASQTQPPSRWGLGPAHEISTKDILPSLERSKYRSYRYRREYSV